MQTLIPIGAVVTLIGLCLLVWCIIRVMKARRSFSDEAELKQALQSTIPLNLAALCLSALGLMMVVVGILLG